MSGYYDLDNILMEQELVPLSFKYDAFRLGFLHRTSDGEDLRAGQRVELPLWLVNSLQVRRAHRSMYIISIRSFGRFVIFLFFELNHE